MARMKIQSPGWEMRSAGVSRGAAAAGGPSGLPSEFLASGASIAEEAVLQPAPAALRGGPAPSSTIDITCQLEPGESAVLAVRHPSGALTFHPPVDTVRPTRGGAVTVRFSAPAHPAPAGPGATRGIVSQAVKAILVKVSDAVVDTAVGLALPKLASLFESTVWKKSGLREGWLKVSPATLAARKLAAGKPVSTERSLLFIHGTFSNAASAFVSLAESDFFSEVAPLYDGRIFAFDHFTLSRTPEENARMLLEGLPNKRFTFDVVTHSRGGLVLRNLVERADTFDGLGRRFQLGRVVLVASPNEGTPLATPRRWEDTIGWVANLLELFPDNPFTTGAEFVANGIVWLAKHAAGDLPGLSAMDGDGLQIRTLQEPPGPPADRYSALVANYSPSGDVLRRLLDIGLDQFFASANDLVVPSEGGWRVDRSGSTFIPGARIGCFGPGGNLPGDAVTHVNIFAQPDAPAFIARALKGEAQTLAPVDPAQSLPDRRLLRAGAAGVATPAAAPGRPAAARRARITGTLAPPRRQTAVPGAFTISVVNGDLSFEKRPLLVGHYRSTLLTGAEAFIDRMTARALSRSLALGIYPVDPGSHQIFLNTHVDSDHGWLTPRPAAVVVVGLGQEGALRPAQLTESVRQAVVRWAQRVMEQDRTTSDPLEIASTLMASGGSGITAAQSAVLIAQGVFEANQILARDGSGLPQVGQLRLVELYTDRAADAWRALRMQAEATPGRFTVTEPIAIGTGSLLRPIESGYRGAAYDHIVATTRRDPGGETAIEYALDTKRARTEVRAQVAQARLLQNLVTEASGQSLDADIGRTLYKLLIPVELEAFLSSATETQIVVDQGTAGIPWELLDADDRSRIGDDPWAVRAKLLRKFKTERFRQTVVDPDARARILVIGEPACPPEYPRLPGAYREARAVADCLVAAGPGLTEGVTAIMAERENDPGPAARSVVGTLFKENWRVVHIAGHGAMPDAEGAGGVVLSDKTFLGPQEIGAMRVVPELVFVNCCHLGSIAAQTVLAERVKFASGVAEKLIDIGVRCVVAAGWAVDDDAATAFAKTFYEALLRKERFIDAVSQARKAAYAFDGNTWAAYQCYGDPDWRLIRDGGDSGSWSPPDDEFDEVATTTGLKLVLKMLAVESTFQQKGPEIQRPRLVRLEARWKKMKWPVSFGVGELFAAAWAAAGDLDEAIRWYDQVLQAGDGRISVRAFEQRSNLRIRTAWRAVELAMTSVDGDGSRSRRRRGAAAAGAARSAEVRRAIDKATRTIAAEIRRLSALRAFGETAERHNLVGSAMKRLSMVHAAAGRADAERKAIVEMQSHYRRALERQRDVEGADIFYPATNLIGASVALGERVPRALFDEARKGLHAKEVDGPDFWTVIGETELRLYEAILARQLSRRQRPLLASLGDLAARVRHATQWGSVYDNATFVLSNYIRRAQASRDAKEVAAATAIREYLRQRTLAS